MVGGAITAAVMSSLGWRSVLMGGGMCASLLVPLVWFGVSESTGGGTHALAVTHSRHPLIELVSERRGWGTVLICAATFLTLLVAYFLLSWTPTILTLLGTSPKRAALATVVLNLGGLAGAWILSSLVRRRNPLVAIAAYLGVGSLLVALLGQGVIGAVSVAFLMVFAVGLLIIGAMSNLPALSVYYYPASVYGTGVGLVMAVGRLGSIVGPLVGGYLVSARVGWDRLFLLAALPALTAAFALALVAVIRKP
jgi:AAHS family 4-hydroxybenzoate transporter-like MFS transporter